MNRLAADRRAGRRPSSRGGDARDQPLHAQHPAKRRRVAGGEGVVARQRLLAALRRREDRPQLAAAGEPEVQRGADPLGGQRQAVAGRVPGEEHPVLGRRRAGRAESSCPGSGRVSAPSSSASRTVGSRTWKRGSNEPTPIRSSPSAGKLQPYPAGHVAAVDPHLQIVAGAERVHLEPAREQRVGRLDVGPGPEHAAPAERVDDQRRADLAAVGVHVDARRRGRLDLRGLELERRPARPAARTASGSRRSRTSTAGRSGRSRAGCG